MLKKYYAVGNKVVLSGKTYKHDEPLPKRREGAYDGLVNNGMAREEISKEKYSASARDQSIKLQSEPEEWGDKPEEWEDEPIVDIKTKKFPRG